MLCWNFHEWQEQLPRQLAAEIEAHCAYVCQENQQNMDKTKPLNLPLHGLLFTVGANLIYNNIYTSPIRPKQLRNLDLFKLSYSSSTSHGFSDVNV